MKKNQITTAIVAFIVILGLWFVFKPSPAPLRVTGIQCSLDEGWLISDDIYFINSSGHDLSEVHVTMTLTGETGAQRSVQRYWAVWHLGEKQQITIAASDTVIKIQRVDLSGSCDQGSIRESYVKK